MANYMYVRSNTALPHADHNREDWHGYLNDLTDAPEWVGSGAEGVCCHTCRVIVVEYVGADGNEPPAADEPKLYLQCDDCGEVFDSIAIAHAHDCPEGRGDKSWSILTEDEAF